MCSQWGDGGGSKGVLGECQVSPRTASPSSACPLSSSSSSSSSSRKKCLLCSNNPSCWCGSCKRICGGAATRDCSRRHCGPAAGPRKRSQEGQEVETRHPRAASWVISAKFLSWGGSMLPKCKLCGYGPWAVLVCAMFMGEEAGCAGSSI